MASSKDLMVIATDAIFQRRVEYYLKQAAISVLSEAGSVTGHNARLVFAQKILSGQASIQDYSVGTVTVSGVASVADVAAADYAVTDSAVQSAVGGLYNAYATVVS